MRNELDTPDVGTLLEGNDISLETTISLGKELIDSKVGPIVHFSQPEITRQSIPVYQYQTLIQNTSRISSTGLSDPPNTAGTSLVKSQAMVTAIGEAIERYCLSMTDLSDFEFGAYSDFSEIAVPPAAFNMFSESQLSQRGLSERILNEEEYHWTATREITSGDQRLVPGQLIYLPFNHNTVFRSPISTGAAAGTGYLGACYRAICEIIERECLMITYLNKLSVPHIDKSTIPDEAKTYHDILKSRGRTVYLLNISLDQPVPTCLAIAVDSGSKPALSLGLGCEWNMGDAIQDALREALQISDWEVEDLDESPTPSDIDSVEERARFWASDERISDIRFWLTPTDKISVEDCREVRDKKPLETILRYLNKRDYECYIADVTTSDVAQYGFKTVRAIIPEMHPMHLREKFRYLGGNRLYEVPVEVGLLNMKNTEKELNQVPQPFL
ncbi:YcaO-like family protein [Haloplanus pelagicus]|uniref:YcaO-like family protein n=1 Tax=Haloplanus pelagicus TaxID=2949995 RepID=UPI00204243E6|nr:YcaO-like family protein [Haloplanus sp. HW8-1]